MLETDTIFLKSYIISHNRRWHDSSQLCYCPINSIGFDYDNSGDFLEQMFLWSAFPCLPQP